MYGYVSNKLLLQNCHYEVLAVFSKGVYLKNGEMAFTVFSEDKGYLAYGIAVEDIRKFIDESRIKVKDDIETLNGIMIINDYKLPLKLIVPEDDRKMLDFNQIAEAREMIKERISKSCSPVLSYQSGKRSTCNDYMSKMCYERVLEFKNVLKNKGNLNESLSMMMGLGVGLTPSMDDFLVGLMSALSYLGNNNYSRLFEAIQSNKAKTCVYSRVYLESVCVDGVGILNELMSSIGTDGLRDLINDVAAIGNTSGLEMLSGIDYGLSLAL